METKTIVKPQLVQQQTRSTVESQIQKVIEIITSESLVNDICKVMIKMDRPSDHWSLGNKLLVLVSGTTDARGFNQWKEVGRYVKKGSRATYILAPMTKTIVKKNKDDKDEYVKIITGFRGVPVFRVQDTEGKELEYHPQQYPELLNVATRLGVVVRYDDTRNQGAYGYFDLKNNEIVLGTEDASTFFHELAHVAHSKIEKLKGGQDAEQETIAQLSACVLARMYGYKCEGYTQQYIKMYTEEKTNLAVAKMAMRVLKKVQAVLELILYENNKEVEVQ